MQMREFQNSRDFLDTKRPPELLAPGAFLRRNYVLVCSSRDYSRLFSSALLNRCMTLPPKVTLILAP